MRNSTGSLRAPFIGLALLASCGAWAGSVQLPEPGYLVIDDAWYGFGARSGPEPSQARLSALDSRGFHLQTVFELGACSRASGQAISSAQSGQSTLSISDSAPGEASPASLLLPLLPLASADPARLRLAFCQGTMIILVRSLDGDLDCAMRLAFPYPRRGICPSLDAADSSFVFYADFD